MSAWDRYLDSLAGYGVKDGEEHIDKGALIGLDGGVWTTATYPRALAITGPQAQEIAACFKSQKFDAFMQAGIKIADVKYQFLRALDGGDDGYTILGKKKDNGSIVIQQSKQAIVIAHCPEGKQQSLANIGLKKIIEYLVGNGY